MSGSLENNFLNEYGGLATEAGDQLGISPSNILSQWALETGYGQTLAGTNNLGNIESDGSPVNYSSPQAFEQSYVSTIQNDFPGAVGAGTSLPDFIAGLASGTNGSYFGTQSASSYGQSVQDTGNSLFQANPSLFDSLLSGSLPTSSSDSSGGGLTSLLGGSAGTADGAGLLGPFGGLLGGTGAGGGLDSSGSSGSSQSGWGAFLGELAIRAALVILGLFLILGAFFILGEQSGRTPIEELRQVAE